MTPIRAAGLPRRLGALLYDALLVLALFMVATALLLPLTHGEAITGESAGKLEHAYRLGLVAIAFGYFATCWTRSGQTLGMLAWRLKLVGTDGALPTWGAALKRAGAACLSYLPCGLGLLWVLVNRERLAWHDRLSGTFPVVVPKAAQRRAAR